MQARGTSWWQIAGAGYLVLMVFAAGFYLSPHILEAPDTSAKVITGALLAAPLAIAFLWGRLKSFKAFGIEIELNDAVVEYVPSDLALEDAITGQQYYSGNQAIIDRISTAFDITDKPVLEINLRSEPYWWSTRLFLQAALLMEHSKITHLAFAEGDDKRQFVGIAPIGDLRQAMNRLHPGLEATYQQIASQGPDTGDLVQQWVASLFDGKPEIDAKILIDSQQLKQVLGDRLDTRPVESSNRQDSELFREVLDHDGRFVPLAREGRLDRIIDADLLARQIAARSV